MKKTDQKQILDVRWVWKPFGLLKLTHIKKYLSHVQLSKHLSKKAGR